MAMMVPGITKTCKVKKRERVSPAMIGPPSIMWTNHHAHPVSMRHGLAWYEFDMNYLQIKVLEKLGLAWDLKVARIAKDAAEIVPQESPDAVDISEAAPVM